MCDCKKNSGIILNTSNCQEKLLESNAVRSIPININDNILIKELVLSTNENFIDITILKNMFKFQELNDKKILTINDYDINDIIKYPKNLIELTLPEIFKKIINLLSKKTCYTCNVLKNLLRSINKESTNKIFHYYNKIIETKNKKYICKIIKIINDPENYKNSKFVVEIDCETYSKFLNFINALNTRKYDGRIKINFGEKNFGGTFYTIIIPDYVKNFTQMKKLVEVLFSSKEIFKQLNAKATIFNFSIPATLNNNIIIYDSYNNFRNNDLYNYYNNNSTLTNASYSFNPKSEKLYFNQLLPRKMFPVD
jgi:hypothetical protein